MGKIIAVEVIKRNGPFITRIFVPSRTSAILEAISVTYNTSFILQETKSDIIMSLCCQEFDNYLDLLLGKISEKMIEYKEYICSFASAHVIKKTDLPSLFLSLREGVRRNIEKYTK